MASEHHPFGALTPENRPQEVPKRTSRNIVTDKIPKKKRGPFVMRDLLSEILLLIGFAMLGIGCGMIRIWLGLIVGGLLFIVVAVLIGLEVKNEPRP